MLMDAYEVQQALAGLELGGLEVLNNVGSTNVEAMQWAESGAPDLALVIANEQTAGRGRDGRKWLTPPGAALAFSLVLRPTSTMNDLRTVPDWHPARYSALGALAVCEGLMSSCGLEAQIKWPNDVLLVGRKTAGVLAEAEWQDNQLKAVILGIGVNVGPASVPPDDQVNFPATCVEQVLGRPVPRFDMLRAILAELLAWRERLHDPTFIQAWESRLALRGEWVEIKTGRAADESQVLTGQILGLDPEGRLKLSGAGGEVFTLGMGEIRGGSLRPRSRGVLSGRA